MCELERALLLLGLVLYSTDCVFQRSSNTHKASQIDTEFFLISCSLAYWPSYTCLRIRLFVYLARLHLCYRLSNSLSKLTRTIFLLFQHAFLCDREYPFYSFSLNTLESSTHFSCLKQPHQLLEPQQQQQQQHQQQQQQSPTTTPKPSTCHF